jgi:hypothetical protein
MSEILKPKYVPLAKKYIEAAFILSPSADWAKSFPYLVCKVREYLHKHPRLWDRFPEIRDGNVSDLIKDYRITENLQEE